MKECSRCGVAKPLAEFHANKSREDGCAPYCKVCVKAYTAEWRKKRALLLNAQSDWKTKTADMVEYRKAWRAAHPGYMTKKKAEWLARNPQRRRVKDATAYAIETGKLVKLPCEVCGESKVEAHHPDYSRPLMVVWLCKQHHKEIHS